MEAIGDAEERVVEAAKAWWKSPGVTNGELEILGDRVTELLALERRAARPAEKERDGS
jgi:hypothetical protein